MENLNKENIRLQLLLLAAKSAVGTKHVLQDAKTYSDFVNHGYTPPVEEKTESELKPEKYIGDTPVNKLVPWENPEKDLTEKDNKLCLLKVSELLAKNNIETITQLEEFFAPKETKLPQLDDKKMLKIGIG